MIASLSDSIELLGFGETLHGGEDILILRNRLFQRLVETHNYSAIESSFPRARIVNEYSIFSPIDTFYYHTLPYTQCLTTLIGD